MNIDLLYFSFHEIGIDTAQIMCLLGQKIFLLEKDIPHGNSCTVNLRFILIHPLNIMNI